MRSNVRQAVPLLDVVDLPRSLGFYVDHLGFSLVQEWRPDGRLRWCRLEHGDAALMLQELDDDEDGEDRATPSSGPPGRGVSLCYFCDDALSLYREWRERGLVVDPPFVGNGLWFVEVVDPDGYRLTFESPTDVAEDTVYDATVHG